MALRSPSNGRTLSHNKKKAINSTASPAKLAKLPDGWPLCNPPKKQSPRTQEPDLSLHIGPVVQASKTDRNHLLSIHPQTGQGQGFVQADGCDTGSGPQGQWYENLEDMVHPISPANSPFDYVNTPNKLASSLASAATESAFRHRSLVESNLGGMNQDADQSYKTSPIHGLWLDTSDQSQQSATQFKLDNVNDKITTNLPSSSYRADLSSSPNNIIPNLFSRPPSHRLSQQSTLIQPLQIGDEVHLTDSEGNDPTGHITYKITQIEASTGVCTLVPVPRPLYARLGRLIRAPIPHDGFASVFQATKHTKNGKQETRIEEVDFGVVKQREVEHGQRRYIVESWTRLGVLHTGLGDDSIAAGWM